MSVKNESKAYQTSFYDMQSNNSYQCAKIVVPIIIKMFKPFSVVDIGCGVGTRLKVFEEEGVKEVLGIDGEYVDKTKLFIKENDFISKDLKKHQIFHKKYDLALSLEVGEHIATNCSYNFIKTITSLSDVVVFSAAQPLQGGQYHINEQWPEFRGELFKQQGFVMLDPLRLALIDYNELEAYRQNMFVYIKKEVYKEKYFHLRVYNSDIVIMSRILFETYKNPFKRFYQRLAINIINISIKLGIYTYLSKIFHYLKK